MTSEIVRLQNVSKRYTSASGESVTVLADASLSVAPGALVAITGVSGSGKSTLLNVIGCLDQPDIGRVEICGTEVTALAGSELAEFRRRHLGFVFQRFNLFGGFTAIENVLVPLRLSGLRGSVAVEKAEEALASVGLGREMHRASYELSVGQMQRVAIARAIVTEPRLVLADEPTGNLDSATKRSVLDLLMTLRPAATLIIATHDTTVADECDERYVFHHHTPVRV